MIPRQTDFVPDRNVIPGACESRHGTSLFDLTEPAKIANPVTTAEEVSDIDALVVAHPLLVRADSKF